VTRECHLNASRKQSVAKAKLLTPARGPAIAVPAVLRSDHARTHSCDSRVGFVTV
jgi:hypothetical protein